MSVIWFLFHLFFALATLKISNQWPKDAHRFIIQIFRFNYLFNLKRKKNVTVLYTWKQFLFANRGVGKYKSSQTLFAYCSWNQQKSNFFAMKLKAVWSSWIKVSNRASRIAKNVYAQKLCRREKWENLIFRVFNR